MTVKQIENALALLEFFADRQRPASLSEIQAEFGWPRSSTYNILTTLVARGYMYEPARRGGYYPTRRWLDTAQTIVEADPIDERMAAVLQALAAETGETAIVAAPAGRYSVYLAVIDSSSPVRYAATPGMRVPIHAGASGRALLSLYGPAERRRILKAVTYKPYGGGALMSPEAVEAEIALSLGRGWFQSLHEYDADLAAIAVPLLVAERRLALVVAGPVSRLGRRCAETAEVLRRVMARMIAP